MGKWLATIAFSLAALAGCGGGSSSPAPAASTPAPAATGANAVPIVVDTGNDGSAFNTPFVSVTVCQPGATTCQTIDHVLVDTASYGLRLVASAASSLALPGVANAAGQPVGECAHFASGYAWGSVHRADIKLAGEVASSIPVQLIDDRTADFQAVPTACSNTGANFGVGQGANGILGVGFFNQDCGSACVSSAAPGLYFACPGGVCTGTALAVASQVANPVPAFAADNNGVVITLANPPPGGSASLAGTLTFGIGTQSNNQMGGATVYTVNSQGDFSTTYKGVAYSASFIDSGSNAIFFPDSTVPTCSGGFYCPSSTLSLLAVNTSTNGVSGTVAFTVENLRSLSVTTAAAHVGADIGLARSIDWGLPFFFGRTVFVAMSGASTPAGNGPYWAY
ncbi:MAG: DUF3443 domain-containing protein [Ramlibacter sp.]